MCNVAEANFSLLCRDRDHAAYAVVGAAQVAVAFLNHDEIPKALKCLLAALEEYQRRDGAISQFHQDSVRKPSTAAQEAA